MTGWLAVLGVTALAGAPHCVGMCGALACAAGGTWREQVPYQVGRAVTYAVLGGLSGTLGHALLGPARVGVVVATVLLVILALSIAGLVPEPRVRIPGLSRVAGALLRERSVVGRLLFGMANGLVPCGLLYAALAVPVGLGSPILGAAAMALFAVLTMPALVAATLGFREVVARIRGGRYVLAAAVLVFGVGSLWTTAGWLPALVGG